MSAYSAALSFRTSHYFVCYLSEVSATAVGIGHEKREDGTYEWYICILHTPYSISLIMYHRVGIIATCTYLIERSNVLCPLFRVSLREVL